MFELYSSFFFSDLLLKNAYLLEIAWPWKKMTTPNKKKYIFTKILSLATSLHPNILIGRLSTG
jgi:hypothetical protein